MNHNSSHWPELIFSDIHDTLDTLHQWIQIVGKIRLKTMPWQNHSWHTTLYVTTNGLSTHSIPYQGTTFQIDFDFKKHQLIIQCSNADPISMELTSMTVAEFYKRVFEMLPQIGVDIKIHARPNEMEPAIPFYENTLNKTYDPQAANAIWRSLLRVNEVFNHFRTDFVGKVSPVHLFWGAFDLAVTRFSGNSAPLHPGGMPNMPLDVMQEAYSQEVSSAGFWFGSKDFPVPVFYSYSYPSGEGFAEQEVMPKEAFYSNDLGEFMLKYEDVRNAKKPEEALYHFLQSTYIAACKTSGWDREKLEKP